MRRAGVEFVSGVILHDETIRQQERSSGEPFGALRAIGIIPVKVDNGAKQLALHADGS
jgi:fructose-bisphosphate aldolase class 1